MRSPRNVSSRLEPPENLRATGAGADHRNMRHFSAALCQSGWLLDTLIMPACCKLQRASETSRSGNFVFQPTARSLHPVLAKISIQDRMLARVLKVEPNNLPNARIGAFSPRDIEQPVAYPPKSKLSLGEFDMSVLSAVIEPQGVFTAVGILLATMIGYILFDLLSQPPFPSKSPTLLKGYPIVGVPMLFSARDVLFRVGKAISKTGNFSFYYGKVQIIAVSGERARKFWFDSKDLDMSQGYEKLFAVAPHVELDPGSENFGTWFDRNLKKMISAERLSKSLPLFTRDIREGFELLGKRENKVMDPYDNIYRMVYQLTMRTVGCDEIAESKNLGDKTLRQFELCEAGSSPARIIIPWLPTPRHFLRVFSAAQLYMVLDKIVKERIKMETKKDDALQMLLDQDTNVLKIIQFIIGALFAGQLNSGINAAAMIVQLAQNPEWTARLRDEVDGVIAKHRASEDESPIDVLSRLDLETWESKFPLIDMGLKETIRIEMVGTAFRKNVAERELKIAGSDEVIPPGAYSIYQIDDAHLNPDIYPNPMSWDPSRFERGEDKRQKHGYLGWGVGRHPCLGMRFAKLEMNMMAAIFITMFDFELADKHGNLKTEPPPPKDRNKFSAHKPGVPVYLRYKQRC
ncbi:cytochrome p450 6a1 [Zalerion maritima]|uniref:Cytochrome p450 6a1 n=1 Tax=Zalerion maritima TaxID=339359 RepID=A0AAD5RKH3_9PEZI|nr:cytochrome p450 6a1 [Zalerion maritima]